MKQHYKESDMKGILIGGVLLVLADITISAPVLYTDEALYLEDLKLLGYTTISEGFEDDAVWGASRSPTLVDSTTSQGLVWKSNYTTSTTGASGIGGTYSFFSDPHGNSTDGPNLCEPDVNDFNDPCWQYDGWIITSAESDTLYGIGGWIRSSKATEVTFLLDGANVKPGRDGEPVSGWTFFGVIDEGGFTSVDILELEGSDYDQIFIWGDSFNVGVSAVPVPAAVWLFGSGLIGLVGIARRKKAA